MTASEVYIRPAALIEKIDALEASKPHLHIERARYLTESFMKTEGEPLFTRWAKALVHIMRNIPIHLFPGDIIAGCFDSGRYGIFYPELDGMQIEANSSLAATYFRNSTDLAVVRSSILPFWKGRTYQESAYADMPSALLDLLYQGGDFSRPKFIVQETATLRHCLQWVHDYGKVLDRGFMGIAAEANEYLKKPLKEQQKIFYSGILLLCHGIRDFADRYAALAEAQASVCPSEQRRNELLELADRCRRVPWEPAKTFADALQAQWFTQLVSRLEAEYGGQISNGRMDQYLLPFYRRDIATGILTEQKARELLDDFWCKIAQHTRFKVSAAGAKIYEDSAHWEFTTIGGMQPSGADATNELSLLILRSAAEFPLSYPYLGVRLHEGIDRDFLTAVCRYTQASGKSPVFLNDKTIIRRQTELGESPEEARGYCGSGFSEARLINKDSYFVGSIWINLPAVLEMAYMDGYCSPCPDERLGLSTGPAESILSFSQLLSNFEIQLIHILNQAFRIQNIMEKRRSRHLATPLMSSLHDLGMKYGLDVSVSSIPEARSIGGFYGIIGFATVLDSLSAIHSLVYEQKKLSLRDMIDILNANFEGFEDVRQMCLASPKYGTANAWVDAIGKHIDRILLKKAHAEKNHFGGKAEIFYVPVKADVAMGRVTGATPDGRFAGNRFSSGTAPVQSVSPSGPGIALMSDIMVQNPELNSMGARVMTLKLLPHLLCSESAPEMLSSLLMTWARQEHWFLTLERLDSSDISDLKNSPSASCSFSPASAGINTQGYSFSPDVISYGCPLKADSQG